MLVSWLQNVILSNAQIVLTILLIIFATATILQWKKGNRCPPGPVGVPFLGYLPFLGNEPHKKLWDLTKKYGKMFSVYFGPSRVIVICDHKLAKEILTHPAALSRPAHGFDMAPGGGGLGAQNGELWQEQRKFVLSKMRDLGLGRGLWENVIQENAEEFVKKVKKFKGRAVDITDPLELSQSENIFSLLFGRHLPKDSSHPDVQRMLRGAHSLIDIFTPSKLSMMAPSLTKFLVLFHIAGYHKIAENMKNYETLMEKEIEDRYKVMDDETERDFIGYYLDEIERQKKSGKKNHFSVGSLNGNLLSLFAGGSDTTAYSLYWLLLLMATHPEIQDQVHDEIVKTVGREKRIYWDERNILPLTYASVLEMERWVSIKPLFPPRQLTEPLNVGDYELPKGSVILCNSWAIMHDPENFEDPYVYDPRRFLRKGSNRFEKMETYFAFSVGKRNCPGESIAMMSIFLYFVALMQKFYIRTADDKPANFEIEYKVVLRPKTKHLLCFIER